MGIEQPARFIVGYIYLSELCPEKQRPIVTSIGMFFASEMMMIAALYFRYMSRDWTYLAMFGII